MKRSSWNGSIIARALLLALALAPAITAPVAADDRDLLRESTKDPYVFIVLDTSGSMHWSPKCPVQVADPDNPSQTIQVPANANDCELLCPSGDCFVPRNGDDPRSKFYQAKQALYETLEGIDDIQFGFATYNQDQLRVQSKHWMYQAAGDGPNIPGYGPFPRVGDQEVFGELWTCDNGSGDAETGCVPGRPADLDDTWEAARVRRLSKGGEQLTSTVTTYVRFAGETYRVRYDPAGSTAPGNDVTVDVITERCRNASCSSRDAAVTRNVVFRPIAEFLAWDNQINRDSKQMGFYNSGSEDPTSGNTCSGWDPNTDTTSDRYSSYSVRWPTVTGDPRGSFFDIGDVIPMDWTNDHKSDILKRLAPNTVLDPSADPDFSVSPYFRNLPNGSEAYLRLKDERARPILATGSTPLGASVRAFRKWYAGCETGVCPARQGWSGVSSTRDPDWSCRRKFLLVLTDGDETCNGNPCAATEALKNNENVTTFVVAFGVEKASGNALECMAQKGGSTAPIYPQNKDELVRALTDIFGQIKEEASAFASAAVPSVQAEVADRIYLSSFTPLNGESVWDGHLDAYLKPLPLNQGRPDRDKACPPVGSLNRSSCHLWDAAEVLLGQAPNKSDLLSTPTLTENMLKLGPAEDERRVFYTKARNGNTIPRTLRLFSPPSGSNPATDPEWGDLFAGLKIDTSNPVQAKKDAEEVIIETLAVKNSTINTATGTRPVRYILGDVFHSDPVVIDRPTDFFLYGANLYGAPSVTDCDDDQGYRCFADRHRYRRKMLVVGSNDGQLHFFDAGYWDEDRERFTDGTGTELFSFMPRLVLPVVRDLAQERQHIYSMDGTPRIEDVFLDTEHKGPFDPSDPPKAEEREWRTLLIGGLREAGSVIDGDRMPDTEFVSGYYALDITQPDKLELDNKPSNDEVVPTCLSLTNQDVTGCGTLPFPAVAWEFTDSTGGSRWDEDNNGEPDLGETWSVPTIGRIKVTEGTKIVDKFVAIFGGGMDAARKFSPQRGNWLYMVDIETGQPIYKRRLVGSAVADPAAIDVDLDGYLDVVYIGTTAGYLYKVNLTAAQTLTNVKLPKARAIPALAADVDAKRIVDADTSRLRDQDWDPIPIFDTLGRPLHFAPVAFYVASLNRFALAFGTGDRENLWQESGQEGRFYMIVDDNYDADDLQAGLLPLSEDSFQRILPDGAPSGANADFVLNPGAGKLRGWYFKLDPDERIITQAFGLAGVVIFSGYKPDQDEDPDDDGLCARGGTSRIFVVFTNNANPLMPIDGVMSRYRTVPEFVTNPYVEQGSTKNPDDEQTDDNSEQLDVTQKQILAALKKFFPQGTKFGNYWISVSGIRSDTGYERYATIPIGIMQRNWKEH
jgi:hypothetical protein